MSNDEKKQDKFKMQFASLKWLFEMEMVDDPILINNLKLNIFSISRSIREVEILSSYHQKAMLVWLELGWFGRKFLVERILVEVEERLKALLPNFRFRVITDKAIFNLAVEKAKLAITGGKREASNDVSSNADRTVNRPSEADLLREESDVLSDKKESSKA